MDRRRSQVLAGIAVGALLGGAAFYGLRSRREPPAPPAPAEARAPDPLAAPRQALSRPPEAPPPPPVSPPAKESPAVAPPPAPRGPLRPPPPPAEPDDGKPLELTFARLMFRYWPPIPGGKDPFPAHIRSLHGRKVAMEGKLDFEKEELKAFIITCSTPGCCQGATPQITHRVKVLPPGGAAPPVPSTVRVTGTFEVGEELDPEGYIVSVYRLKADSLTPIATPVPLPAPAGPAEK